MSKGLIRLNLDINLPEGTLRAGTFRKVVTVLPEGDVEIPDPFRPGETLFLEYGEFTWVRKPDESKYVG